MTPDEIKSAAAELLPAFNHCTPMVKLGLTRLNARDYADVMLAVRDALKEDRNRVLAQIEAESNVDINGKLKRGSDGKLKRAMARRLDAGQ
jgi:Tfp pilus assembly protein PilF